MSICFLVLCVRYVPVHGNARLGAPRTHLEGSAHLGEMGQKGFLALSLYTHIVRQTWLFFFFFFFYFFFLFLFSSSSFSGEDGSLMVIRLALYFFPILFAVVTHIGVSRPSALFRLGTKHNSLQCSTIQLVRSAQLPYRRWPLKHTDVSRATELVDLRIVPAIQNGFIG